MFKITGVLKGVTKFDGVSKAGKEYSVGTILLVTGEGDGQMTFPFEVFGENNISEYSSIEVGSKVTVDFDIFSNEWNGKYFIKLVPKNYVVENVPSAKAAPRTNPADRYAAKADTFAPPAPIGGSDELPF